ncbi:MAG: LD-carboxypeptidase [Candidatus Manganitrophus sp.]|nr:LD-carboxypeptidase [Candidatus Manganitrophus sp.]WDT71115.1 MAG: LD-carboxypeptidase [Candidatus Manganitrophus sp.]WDT81593.1 MAG: LD-carboxypeptidase [Candidatus Manganitrophus sp.]
MSNQRRQSIIKPKRLSPGETIGVVAPAGRVEPADLHRGVLRLEQLGFKVIVGRHVEKSHRYLAGKDPDRAADLRLMFENRDVRAVLCARGALEPPGFFVSSIGTALNRRFSSAAAMSRPCSSISPASWVG